MYSQTDLDNVKNAILELAMGKRVGQVTVRGRTFRYADVTLSELRKLEKDITKNVAPVKRTRMQVIEYDKGT